MSFAMRVFVNGEVSKGQKSVCICRNQQIRSYSMSFRRTLIARGLNRLPVGFPKRATLVRAGDEAASLLSEIDAILAQVGSMNSTSKSSTVASSLSPDEESSGVTLHCDVNGCVIVPIKKREPAPTPKDSFVGTSGFTEGAATSVESGMSASAPRDFQMSEGKGWKLGHDRAPRKPDEYSALVGADDWSIALTRPEYNDFITLVKNLRKSIATLEICGEWGTGQAESDDATLEMSTDRVWMQGRAPQNRLSALQDMFKRGLAKGPREGAAFSLRFIIKTDSKREVAGSWGAEAVMGVLQHLDAQDNPPVAAPAAQQKVSQPSAA